MIVQHLLSSVNRVASATTVREVRCVHCDARYHFRARARANGVSWTIAYLDHEQAEARAVRRALHSAQKRATQAPLPVACPACGRIQPDMVGELRRMYIRRRSLLGLIAACSLTLISLCIALLGTSFGDEPLNGDARLAAFVFAGLAAALFLAFGAWPYFASRWLQEDYFGPMNVPIGIPGEPPAAAATSVPPSPPPLTPRRRNRL